MHLPRQNRQTHIERKTAKDIRTQTERGRGTGEKDRERAERERERERERCKRMESGQPTAQAANQNLPEF